MKLQLRDVLSLSGRDHVVEGLVSYRLAGKISIMARAVAEAEAVWIEWPADSRVAAEETARGATADRLLVLRQIRDLDLSAPPPASIRYQGVPYVLRLTGCAALAVEGAVPERVPGSVQLWRYRTAGDQILQIEEEEEENGRLFMLSGRSVHRGMIDHLPGR